MFETGDFAYTVKNKILFKIVIHLVLAFAIWLIVASYLKPAGIQDFKKISAIISVTGIFILYIGRYIALYFVPQGSSANRILVSGAIFILGGIIYLISWANIFQFQLENSLIVLPVIVLGFVFLISGIVIKTMNMSISARIKSAEMSASHSKSELQLLHAQLSPHFLFNTLNNLYGLSLSEPQKMPDLILKLSDLLRYSIYEAEEKFVPISSEIEYLHHYIDFEKIRLGERLEFTEELEDNNIEAFKIAPMILIVFLENAFKHSKNSQNEKIQISVKLQTRGNAILYHVKNSYDGKLSANAATNPNNGLGLENVRKRLNLLYPGEHDLKIAGDGAFFDIRLQLNIK